MSEQPDFVAIKQRFDTELIPGQRAQIRRAAWISIIGFLSVLFTYVGVNLLLSGLHSYA